MASVVASAYRDLRLFWKLLLPGVIVTVVIGVAGTFGVVRYLSVQAQEDLDQAMTRRSLVAVSHVDDETLYVLDAVRLAANLQGMSAAVRSGDETAVRELLGGVLAVRTRLDRLAAIRTDSTSVVEVARRGEVALVVGTGGSWSDSALINRLLTPEGGQGATTVGVLSRGDTAPGLAAAASISDAEGAAGAVVAALDWQTVVRSAGSRADATVAAFDLNGNRLAGPPTPRPPRLVAGQSVRVQSGRGEQERATLYVPLTLRNEPVGTLAVIAPSSIGGDVRDTGRLITLLAMIAMVLLVGASAVVSRAILSQVRGLLGTSRALGAGDFGARARAEGGDELGELAEGFNTMAERLEASHSELERQVAARTEELQRLYDEVLSASTSRSQFFAAASHELRTPLFAIMAHAELMADPKLVPTQPGWAQEFGETIRSSGEYLLTRVNEILELAKLEARGAELSLETIELSEEVAGVMNPLTALARSYGQKLEVDIGADLPPIKADRQRFREILVNLVSNALKYTPRGGLIEVKATRAPGRVVVTVRDNGVGIPPTAHDHLFEPFYRVEGTATQGGQASSGLGLAVTKRLVEAHGGEISFTSAVGEGSTFRVAFLAARRRKVASSAAALSKR